MKRSTSPELERNTIERIAVTFDKAAYPSTKRMPFAMGTNPVLFAGLEAVALPTRRGGIGWLLVDQR